jgi:peptide/nickel transport system permease protein
MRGADYVVKRVLFAIGTVFVAITLNFVLFRAVSGDATMALRCRQCTQEFQDYQRHRLGLDKSKWEQYRIYLGDLAQGNLGRSLRTEEPVTKGALWGGLGFYSMPPQWLGLVIVLFVAARLGLPTSGIKDPSLGILSDPGFIEVFVDRLEHMLLPALTLGLVIFGEYTLIVRSAMLETLGEDYILTSRAKGLTNWATVWKHGFRNAMLPVITLVALSLGYIIGGAITVEYVFSYPGIGLLIVEAIDQRDYSVLQGAFLLLTLSVIFFNLLADLLYFKLDPRVQE